MDINYKLWALLTYFYRYSKNILPHTIQKLPDGRKLSVNHSTVVIGQWLWQMAGPTALAISKLAPGFSSCFV